MALNYKSSSGFCARDKSSNLYLLHLFFYSCLCIFASPLYALKQSELNALFQYNTKLASDEVKNVLEDFENDMGHSFSCEIGLIPSKISNGSCDVNLPYVHIYEKTGSSSELHNSKKNRPLVVIVQGRADCLLRYLVFCMQLFENLKFQNDIVIFDHRGQGLSGPLLSENKRSMIHVVEAVHLVDDFAQVLKHFCDKGYQHIHAIAQSMGGGIVLKYLQEQAEMNKGVIDRTGNDSGVIITDSSRCVQLNKVVLVAPMIKFGVLDSFSGKFALLALKGMKKINFNQEETSFKQKKDEDFSCSGQLGFDANKENAVSQAKLGASEWVSGWGYYENCQFMGWLAKNWGAPVGGSTRQWVLTVNKMTEELRRVAKRVDKPDLDSDVLILSSTKDSKVSGKSIRDFVSKYTEGGKGKDSRIKLETIEGVGHEFLFCEGKGQEKGQKQAIEFIENHLQSN